MEEEILREQLAYYRARASEYDAYAMNAAMTQGWADELAQMKRVLQKTGRFEHILELACGTGTWTGELLKIGQIITAIDASPEMLEINRARIADKRVHYLCSDLFDWEPDQEYDMVFLALWLSHVPPDLIATFLKKICRATSPHGQVFILDEPSSAKDNSVTPSQGIYQCRTLSDGRTFMIVKVYYAPDVIRNHLTHLCFDRVKQINGRYFFALSGRRA